MNTLFKKSAVTATIILTSLAFVSCKNTEKASTTKPINLAIENSQIYTVKEEVATRNPLVFITGYDKGNSMYYENARAFFQEKNFEIVEDQYSLEEIINWLNTNENGLKYGEIHIVNKSNPFNGMSLETVVKGDKITTETLRKNIEKGNLPTLNKSVNANSKIIFHANGLGENTALMNAFKDAFCAEELPNVVASPYYTIFDGDFTKHYLAKPFYVFYPTANSPGKIDLSKEIAQKYPQEKNIDWLQALYNEEERFVGEPYTTQFTIPVKFQLDYHNSDNEAPVFTSQEEIIMFIELEESLFAEVKKLNIPLNKFRWTYNMNNSTLTIKGLTTGLTVLKPLIKPYGELQHITPDTNNKRLYAIK